MPRRQWLAAAMLATGAFLGPDPCRDLEPVDAHRGRVEQDQ